MWSRLYRNHVMLAFPTYDSAKHAWAPQVDINWFLGAARDSKFVRFPTRCMTEEEAVRRALARGQTWVDNRLKRMEGVSSKRRRMFDMIHAFKANPERLRTAQPAPKRTVKPSLSFEEFVHLLAHKGFTLSAKTLQRSFAALVKAKRLKHWSWAQTKRKLVRAGRDRVPAGATPRVPVTERAWCRIL